MLSLGDLTLAFLYPSRASDSSLIWLRKVGVLLGLVFLWSSADAQIDRAAYTQASLNEVAAAHEFRVGTSAFVGRAPILISAEYKYRILLYATGRVRDLSPESEALLVVWSSINPRLSVLLQEYTHEVEVEHDSKRFWLYWQRGLVRPFAAERREGGDIDIYAVLAGSVEGRLLLFVTAYEPIL